MALSEACGLVRASGVLSEDHGQGSLAVDANKSILLGVFGDLVCGYIMLYYSVLFCDVYNGTA